MNYSRFIRQLYNENREWIHQNALRDYHVKGFNSIVLAKSPQLTIRLYVCFPDEHELDDPFDNTLLVHDHSFDFECTTLAGYMANFTYDELPGENWYKYEYQSALKEGQGTMSFIPLGRCNLEVVNAETVYPGESYYFDSRSLHKIAVPKDLFVSMLFWEYSHIEKPSLLYSMEPLDPEVEPDGLYNRFDIDELDRTIETVCRNVGSFNYLGACSQ